MYLTITNIALSTIFFTSWIFLDLPDDEETLGEQIDLYNSSHIQECIQALNELQLNRSIELWTQIENQTIEQYSSEKNASVSLPLLQLESIVQHIVQNSYESNGNFSISTRFISNINHLNESVRIRTVGYNALLSELIKFERISNSSDLFTLGHLFWQDLKSTSTSNTMSSNSNSAAFRKVYNSFPTPTLRKYLRNIGQMVAFKSTAGDTNGYIYPSSSKSVYLWKSGSYVNSASWIISPFWENNDYSSIKICSNQFKDECLSSTRVGNESLSIVNPANSTGGDDFKWILELLENDNVRIKSVSQGEFLVVGGKEFDFNSRQARIFTRPESQLKNQSGIWEFQAFV